MAETLIATADRHGNITVQNDTDELINRFRANGLIQTLTMGTQQGDPYIAATVYNSEAGSHLQAWDIHTPRPLFTENQAVFGAKDCDSTPHAGLALLNRGDWLYTITQDKSNRLGLRKLEYGRGKAIESLSMPGRTSLQNVGALSLHASGHTAYMGGDNGIIYKWDLGEIAESSAPRTEIWLPSYLCTGRQIFGATCLAQGEKDTLYAGDSMGALHTIVKDRLTRTVYSSDNRGFYRGLAIGKTQNGNEMLAIVRESGSNGRTSALSVLPAEAGSLDDALLTVPSIQAKERQEAVTSRTVAITELQGERCVMSGASDGLLYAWRLPDTQQAKRKPDIMYDVGDRMAIHTMATLVIES